MRLVVSVLLSCSLSFGCGDPAEPAPKPDAQTPDAQTPDAKEPAAAAPDANAPAAAAFQIVNLPPGGELPGLLAEHAALAKQANLAPFVELWAEWCPPCKKLEAAMGDPRIEKAFAGVYLIRLDSDQWSGKLEGTGLDASAIPVFFELDAQGKVTGRKIDGGAWGEDVPENMAPPLDAFFHGRQES
ncbi:TlpA family protein disulfide reductase [Paraliomyxa miuraensis]|uniref:TlpA family protein disulfide reductase n=1 Tax=Paraliomyxa miuraensis TaxID=376150 RepID=UPI002257D21E|nr:thioredoxin domain-containing protein [Paraliomyxa miuraensis]MCX4240250.1 thioredoxin domain-containing protein [Paraliomyxa miuraensis]